MVLAVESNNDNVNSTLVINFANIYLSLIHISEPTRPY